MLSIKRAPLLLLTGLASLATAAPAAPPDANFANLPAYIQALNQSRDPQAAAIRREIADGPAALARERAAALADNISLDPKSWQPSVPPDQNAAPLWEKWDTLRHGHVRLPNYAEVLRTGYAYTPEQLARVQKIFDDNRSAMDLLHQAADKPGLAFPDDNMTHYAALREAARELKSESYLLAHQGLYADAIAEQARGFRIAKQIVSRPTLGDYLTGVGIEAITLSGMKDILDLAGPNADVSAQVRQAIQGARPVLSLKAALAGDATISLSGLEKLRAGTPADLAARAQEDSDPYADLPQVKAKSFTPEERRFGSHLLDAAEANYLSQMRRLVDAADEPGPERHAVFASLQNAGPAPSWDPIQQLNPALPLNQILLPAFGRMDDVDNRTQAQEEVTLAGAALLSERARTGRFPDALPGGFLDPFTGHPLGYRREGDTGFVVYSVGPDGRYDGGKSGEDEYDPNHASFRFPGPTPKPVPAELQ